MEGANICLKDHDIQLNTNQRSISDLQNKISGENTFYDLKMKDELLSICQNSISSQTKSYTDEIVTQINQQKDEIKNMMISAEKKELLKVKKQLSDSRDNKDDFKYSSKSTAVSP